jgi:hypothetical protein
MREAFHLPFGQIRVCCLGVVAYILCFHGAWCAAQTAGARATVFNGFVVDVTITNSGYWYSVPPSVTFLGGGGAGAMAVATNITNGSVASIKIIDAGTGYTTPPEIVIEPPLFDLHDTLVGYWPFEGNLYDHSDYSDQNGTISGSISYLSGAVGTGAAISGTSYVSFGDPSDGRFDIALNQDFSAALWVKTTMSSGLWYPMLLTKDLGWNNDTRVGWAIHFDMTDNGLPVFVTMVPPAGPGWCQALGSRVNNGEWHFLTATKRGPMLAFYVDGLLRGSGSCANGNYSTSIPLRLGWSENTTFAAYQGAVDELRLYKRALEPREIACLYERLPVITHPKSLRSYWGQTATFSVTVRGDGPMFYQWFKDGQAMQDQTNAAIQITNIQNPDAGVYSVTVSNLYGRVYSRPATLEVNAAGVVPGLYAGFTLNGPIGQEYTIQATTNLGDTNSWITLTNITLDQPVSWWFDKRAPVHSSDPVTSSNYLRNFYRVLPGH